MIPAVLTFTFDPVVKLSESTSVRIEVIALAAVLLAGLLLGARMGMIARPRALRIDDLVFILVGAVPGAVLGGRLGYVLGNLDYYLAHPGAIVDPGQGALTLSLAIPGGLLTGGVIGRLIGAPVGRWLHAAALPLLFVLAAGKLVGVLGGSGQGAPSDLVWATSYQGPGPWGSLAAAIPAHPSQVYEGLAGCLAVAAVWLVAWRSEVVARGQGSALFVAIGAWAIIRLFVGFTWREPPVLGPLRAEQLLALAVLAMSSIGFVERARTPVAPAWEAEADAEADAEANLA